MRLCSAAPRGSATAWIRPSGVRSQNAAVGDGGAQLVARLAIMAGDDVHQASLAQGPEGLAN